MKSPLFFGRCLLAGMGMALLLTSAVLLGASVFGSWRFALGWTFHLVGQACCLSMLCLPGWWKLASQQRAMRLTHGSSAPTLAAVGSIRPARFRPEVQTLRLLYTVGAAIVMLCALTVGAIGLRSLLLLREHGVMTPATITGTTFREAGPMLTVTYAFVTPHGLPVTDTFRAPRHLLQSLPTGNTLRVTYLPSDPTVHTWERVDNGLVARHFLSGVVVLLTLAAYTALPLLLIERRLRRQLRLARVGLGVTGSIMVCKPLLWRKKKRGYLLTYAFATPGRQVFIGRALVPYIPDEPTLPGFPLTVLYDPLVPGISLPLAAFHIVELPNIRKTVLAA